MRRAARRRRRCYERKPLRHLALGVLQRYGYLVSDGVVESRKSMPESVGDHGGVLLVTIVGSPTLSSLPSSQSPGRN